MMQKPTVNIKDCSLTTLNSWGLDTRVTRLTGVVLDYPDDHQAYKGCLQNGKRVWTTEIESISDDKKLVETKRTIYRVENWETVPTNGKI